MSSPSNPWIDPSARAEPTSPEVFSSPSSPPASAEPPAWTGIDVLQIALLMFLSPFVVVLGVAFAAQRIFYHGLTWVEVAQQPMMALLAEFLVYLVVVIYMVLLVEGRYHRSFLDAIHWNWPSRVWPALVLTGVVMLIGLQILAHFVPFPKQVPFDQFFKRPLEAYLTSIFAVSLGPLMEELFFRGFLYPVLLRRMGMLAAIFLTALGFGMIHALQLGFAWGPVLMIFMVGMVLTIIRAVRNSVASSLIVHVAYNSTLTVLALIGSSGFRHLERLH